MAFYIGGASAIEFWRLCRAGQPAHSATAATPHRTHMAAHLKPLDSEPITAEAVRSLHTGNIGLLSSPLHLYVSSSAHRNSRYGEAWPHVWSTPLPAYAHCTVADGTHVATPELALLQIAPKLHVVALADLVCEFCGTYSVVPNGKTLYQLQPLLTLDSLRVFLADLGTGAPGVRKLARAQELSFADAASPPESKLALLLATPTALGGFGLHRPVLNHRVDIETEALGLSTKNYHVIDLCWPQSRFGLEFDSRLFHDSSSARTQDARKANALGYMGVTVLPVTGAQLYNPQDLLAIAKRVAKETGTRLRSPLRNKTWDSKRLVLHSLLLNDGAPS